MIKYHLANTDCRKTVCLKSYEEIIKNSVHKICPDTRVIVEDDGYIILDDVSRGDKIKIGLELAHTSLGKYSLERPILFRGKNIDKQNDKTSQKNMSTDKTGGA